MNSFLRTLLAAFNVVNSEVSHLKQEAVRTASVGVTTMIGGGLLLMGLIMLHLALFFALEASMGVPGALLLVGLIASCFGGALFAGVRLWVKSNQ